MRENTINHVSGKGNLIIADNDFETRGRILRSKTADKQGMNRLDRGKYFYEFSKETAKNQIERKRLLTMAIRNTGESAIIRIEVINELSGKQKVKCFEIPRYA